MAKRTAAEITADLLAVGFDSAAAATMTAIALAESGGDDTALGDVSLETNVWGPSYGLFQVRSLKGDTGRGTDRDAAWLAQSDANQAKAAYDISAHGTDFTPWTTYTRGTYQQYLGQAQQALATALPAQNVPGPVPTWGPSWLPWNLPGNLINPKIAQSVGGARTIAIEAIFVIAGVAVAGVGIYRAIAPKVKPKLDEATHVAETAALL